MIYGVFGGCYSNWYIVGYFSDRKEAELKEKELVELARLKEKYEK